MKCSIFLMSLIMAAGLAGCESDHPSSSAEMNGGMQHEGPTLDSKNVKSRDGGAMLPSGGTNSQTNPAGANQ